MPKSKLCLYILQKCLSKQPKVWPLRFTFSRILLTKTDKQIRCFNDIAVFSLFQIRHQVKLKNQAALNFYLIGWEMGNETVLNSVRENRGKWQLLIYVWTCIELGNLCSNERVFEISQPSLRQWAKEQLVSKVGSERNNEWNYIKGNELGIERDNRERGSKGTSEGVRERASKQGTSCVTSYWQTDVQANDWINIHYRCLCPYLHKANWTVHEIGLLVID